VRSTAPRSGSSSRRTASGESLVAAGGYSDKVDHPVDVEDRTPYPPSDPALWTGLADATHAEASELWSRCAV